MGKTLKGSVVAFIIMASGPWTAMPLASADEEQKASGIGIRYDGAVTPGRWLRNVRLEYTFEGKKATVLLQMFFPKGYKKGVEPRSIIALHGPGDSPRDWINETNIDGHANTFNIAVICPDMGKSVYETKYYPETQYKWGPMPGGRFVGEVLVPALRDEFGIAVTRAKTGITGTSGGARGAMIVAGLYRGLFSVAAGFAGNYDHVTNPKDRYLVDVYGEYNDFRDRWENDDNLMKIADNLAETNIYLFHGFNDNTVPKDQSKLFAMKLNLVRKQLNTKVMVRYRERRYTGHDWKSWNRGLQEAMEFFDTFLAK